MVLILVRPCNWQNTTLRNLTVLPDSGKPIATWLDQNAAWDNVAEGILLVCRYSATKRAGNRPTKSPAPRPEDRLPIDKIFSVSGIPSSTFVKPAQFVELLHMLRTHGTIVIVEGPVGVGKTTAVHKALSELGMERLVTWTSGAGREAPTRLNQIFVRARTGHGVIDDFDMLPPDQRESVARRLVGFTDWAAWEGAITLIGRPGLSAILLDIAPDLAGRFTTIYMDQQPNEKIDELIARGEQAANVIFTKREKYVRAAAGSFYIAQVLCREAATSAGVVTTASRPALIDEPDRQIIEVVTNLALRFRRPLAQFVIEANQAPQRGAGLALLWLLSQDTASSLSLETAKYQSPQFTSSFDWLMDGHLVGILSTVPSLAGILFYEPVTRRLSCNDAALPFYLRHVNWEALSRETSLIGLRWDPTVGPLFDASRAFRLPSDAAIRKIGPLPPSTVLHLSDLHFTRPDQAPLWFEQLATDLRALGHERLGAVIVSGNIAAHARRDEYRSAAKFLRQLGQAFSVDPQHLVLVPGNHDVNWDLPESQRFAPFAEFYRDVRHISYPLVPEYQATLQHLPAQRLLILGLNSAWRMSREARDAADIHRMALLNALNEMYNNPAFAECLKLAVWHHPITGNGSIENTSFLDALAQAGFRIGLHGHVHEAATHPSFELTVNGQRMSVLGTGTSGASSYEKTTATPLQYQNLRFAGNKLTVETRRREKSDGPWQPDAHWIQQPSGPPLPKYEILL